MNALITALVDRNPLLAHGPRTHATSTLVPPSTAPRVPARRRRRRPLDVDAPRVHLGHAGRR